MGYHPHGVLGYGAIAAFGTDVLKFPEIFPGLTPRLITLKLNFQVGCFCFCKILLVPRFKFGVTNRRFLEVERLAWPPECVPPRKRASGQS